MFYTVVRMTGRTSDLHRNHSWVLLLTLALWV